MNGLIRFGLLTFVFLMENPLQAAQQSEARQKQLLHREKVAALKAVPLEDLAVILKLLKTPLKKSKIANKSDMWKQIGELLTFHRHRYNLWLHLAQRGKSKEQTIVVIPSYNSPASVEKNLNLIFAQSVGIDAQPEAIKLMRRITTCFNISNKPGEWHWLTDGRAYAVEGGVHQGAPPSGETSPLETKKNAIVFKKNKVWLQKYSRRRKGLIMTHAQALNTLREPSIDRKQPHQQS